MTYEELFSIGSKEHIGNLLVGFWRTENTAKKKDFSDVCFARVPTSATEVSLSLHGIKQPPEAVLFIEKMNCFLGEEHIRIAEDGKTVSIVRNGLGDFAMQSACQMARNLFEGPCIPIRTMRMIELGVHPIVSWYVSQIKNLPYYCHTWAHAGYGNDFPKIPVLIELFRSKESLDSWSCGTMADLKINALVGHSHRFDRDEKFYARTIEPEKLNMVHLGPKEYAIQLLGEIKKSSRY